MDVEKYRNDEFPVSQNLIYMNHAGVSPIPVRSATAGVAQLREYLTSGAYNLRGWQDVSNAGRGLFARLVGASPLEVAFVKNTSEGLSFVAGGLSWEEGDNVVTTSYEFPANLYPWLALEERGVEVKMVDPEEGKVPKEALLSAVDENTRLIAVSSVEFINGFSHDLKGIGRFCREEGIYFCVDGIQSLGVIPMSVEDYYIDFLAADGHKWLLSIEGIGCLYVSKRVMEKLRPIEYGWHSIRNRFDFETIDFTLDGSAKKFEPGSFNALSIAVFSASLTLIEELGVIEIQKRITGLVDYLVERLDPSWPLLTSLEPGERSGILTFQVPRVDNKELCKRLHKKKVVLSNRGGGIRVSPHFYNTEAEIDTFLTLLKETIEEVGGK
jgi:selenocysteine lyase/cysteine desulfurase